MDSTKIPIETALYEVFEIAAPSLGAQKLAEIIIDVLAEKGGSITYGDIVSGISHRLASANEKNDVHLKASTLLAMPFFDSCYKKAKKVV